MYRIYALFMFMLATLNVDQVAHAIHHNPPAISDAQIILEADSHGTSEHLHGTENEEDYKVYWTLSAWQSKHTLCQTPADKTWTDWIYHRTCESYNFAQLRFDPEQDGIYRLCVYATKNCDDLLYETSSGKTCLKVPGPWAKSWSIIKAVEKC